MVVDFFCPVRLEIMSDIVVTKLGNFSRLFYLLSCVLHKW